MEPKPEPWLRGLMSGVPAHVLPVFFSFLQVREDLAHHTLGLTDDQVWRPLTRRHSLGYHLKHIAGSVDRLTTYLAGSQLSPAQLHFLHHEHTPDGGLEALLSLIHENLHTAEQLLLLLPLHALFETRVVGQKLLPTSVNGLLVHVCEHTQRHLGQSVLLAQLLR